LLKKLVNEDCGSARGNHIAESLDRVVADSGSWEGLDEVDEEWDDLGVKELRLQVRFNSDFLKDFNPILNHLDSRVAEELAHNSNTPLVLLVQADRIPFLRAEKRSQSPGYEFSILLMKARYQQVTVSGLGDT
jgi:hypothetical protein